MSFLDVLSHVLTGTPQSVATTVDTLVCPKCVINNQGRVTCCAKGGSWYQKCRRVGIYTWEKGFQACKNAGSDQDQEAHAHVKLSQNIVHQQSMDSTDTAQSNYNDLKNLSLFNALLLTVLYGLEI